MTDQAKATLQISNWEESPYQDWDGGAKLVRAVVSGTFSGDLEGDGSAQILMAYHDAQTSSFVGLQLVDGSLAGKSGRFVMQITGTFEGGTAQVEWTVMPGSATGELVGLRGTGGYVAGPGDFPNITVSLDYELS